MKHPGVSELALLAGGELSFPRRVRVSRHVSRCAACRAQADGFRSDHRHMQGELAELPEGIHWEGLAAEMTGNIRVGLAAGECVGPVPGTRRLPVLNFALPGLQRWGLGALAASLCLLLTLGWFMKMAPSDTQALARALQTVWAGRGPGAEQLNAGRGVILEANTGGIEVKQNGRAMRFVSPSAEAVTVSVSLQGSAQASYVDSQTGQVTIANVYAQ
ncbi:MAG: hypothetical protein ABI165_12880 [Bryobacteraceae bacterium]